VWLADAREGGKMGALAGTITMTCYYVQGEIPKDFKTSYLEALRKNAFTEIDLELEHDESMGWVTIHDPFNVDFELNDVLWGSYLMVALRHDTIRLPAAAVKLHVRKAVADATKKSGKEKLSKSEVEEIKDRLEKQLKKKALPNIKTFDMVWNMERGVVWLWSTNKKVNEQFIDFFQETFGLVPSEKNPYAQMEQLGFTEELLEKVLDLEPAAMSAPPGESRRRRRSA
jgi:DNA recombination-dependent growth factor C